MHMKYWFELKCLYYMRNHQNVLSIPEKTMLMKILWMLSFTAHLWNIKSGSLIIINRFKALIDNVNSDWRMIRLSMLSLLVLWGRGHGARMSRLPHSLFSHWLSAWPSLALALSAVETLQYGWRRGRGGPVEPCITCPSDRLPHVSSHHISTSPSVFHFVYFHTFQHQNTWP